MAQLDYPQNTGKIIIIGLITIIIKIIMITITIKTTMNILVSLNI